MTELSGNLLGLSAADKTRLLRLFQKRVNPRQVIQAELARKVSEIADSLGRQIALLVGRDGSIEHVAVGTKERVYLPDLGRYRLDAARLRRMRLIVFIPDAEMEYVYSEGKRQLLPTVPQDLLTDLEKLRLDALLLVATSGPLRFVTLRPGLAGREFAKKNSESLRFNFFPATNFAELNFDFLEIVSELERQIKETTAGGFETGKNKAVLIGAYTSSAQQAEASMSELKELARTAGIQILDVIIQRRRRLDPKTVIGAGKVEEVVLHCLELGAEMLVFDQELAPGQLRSIVRLTDLKVIDRSMLILDIFAARAKSSEGRLQVELAQLKYSLPRLTESDSGLSRLSGGIGGRGPGETKLEISRRRARDRIADLERRIDKVAEQRGLRRERRQDRGVPVIAIVGYTNAGKSTLLNALTKGAVITENKMFSTLDTSSRRMRFPSDREVVFVDTVGFIRELPKELLAAFRATLEEVGEADLLIHLVDASSLEAKQQIEVVQSTLKDLGFAEKPLVLVFNKIDLLSEMETKSLLNAYPEALPVSALSRSGFPGLLEELEAGVLKISEQRHLRVELFQSYYSVLKN